MNSNDGNVLSSHFKDTIALYIIPPFTSVASNHYTSFLPTKIMDARTNKCKRNSTNEGEILLHASNAHVARSQTVSLFEHQYHGLSNVSCSNVNGHLKLVADMQSYPNGNIQPGSMLPSLTPIAPTFTTINQATNNSLNASDRVLRSLFLTSQISLPICRF